MALRQKEKVERLAKNNVATFSGKGEVQRRVAVLKWGRCRCARRESMGNECGGLMRTTFWIKKLAEQVKDISDRKKEQIKVFGLNWMYCFQNTGWLLRSCPWDPRWNLGNWLRVPLYFCSPDSRSFRLAVRFYRLMLFNSVRRYAKGTSL